MPTPFQITRFGTARLLALLAAIPAMLFLLQCKESGTFNPVGPPVRLILIDQLAADPNRVSVGGGESVVSGRVIDQDDQPYGDLIVSFSAARGTIPAADTTDDSGRFSVRYRAGDIPGVDTVTVRAEEESAFVLITLAGASAELTINLSTTSILANGLDTALVTATLVGRDGPLNRIPIRFQTSRGGFTGQLITFAQTDLDGRAQAVLTSASDTSTITATITATVEDQQGSPRPSGKGGSRAALVGEPPDFEIAAEASIPITFRGVSVAVDATPTLIPGDGQATAEIRAYVKEQNLQAVPNAPVTFSARLGSIPFRALTDASGVARVSLTSAPLPGATDRIVARYGPQLSDSIEVSYAPAVGRIALRPESASFLADGVKRVRLIATVFSGTGGAAPGVQVDFASDGGTLFPDRAFTGGEGEAETFLIGDASTIDRLIAVTASVADGVVALDPAAASLAKPSVESGRISAGVNRRRIRELSSPEDASSATSLNGSSPNSRDLADELTARTTVLARGVQIRLSSAADSMTARAGQTTTITARVFETTSGNPVARDTVRFGVTLGSIAGSAQLDGDGVARVSFNAGDVVGRAEITGRFGAGLRDTVSVELLPTIGGLIVEPDRPAILAGGIDTVQIRAQAIDPLGSPAPNIQLLLELEGTPGVIARAFTDPSGRAEFRLKSPPVESDTAFRATVRAGQISQTVRVGLKAIRRIISADPDSLSAGSDDPASIIYQAFEASTRRPVTGDTIWFSGFGGVVQPFAVLDAQGIARTSFRPGSEAGVAGVFGQLGELSPDTARLTLVPPVAVVSVSSARRSLLRNGADTTSIAAQVSNLLGQPAPGVWVQFSARGGSIAPLAAQTGADGIARATLVSSAGTADSVATVSVSAIEAARVVGTPLEPSFADVAPITTRSGSPKRAPRSVQGESPESQAVGEASHPFTGSFIFKPILAPLGADDVRDSLNVSLRGVTLSLRVSPSAIRADGRSKTAVRAQLTETATGSAIASGRLRIGATLGSIASEGQTGPDGLYNDSLAAGVVPGTSIVRVFYGEGVIAQDTAFFSPDPARQSMALQITPAEAPAGSDGEFSISTRIIDAEGTPSEGIAVAFTVEGADWALVDPAEYREVARWENTFRVEDREALTSMRLHLQLRGVESDGTRISINRNRLDNAALPEGELWGDYILTLPVNHLLDGVNRIEITGGQDQGVVDRFSVAGIRLGLVGSHLIASVATDRNGIAETALPFGRVAGQTTIRAALAEAPNRFQQRAVRLLPGEPAFLHLSTASDTLLASGAEQTEFLVLAADSGGNPVGSGREIRFAAAVGGVTPESAETLGDGAAGGVYTSPALEEDRTTELTAAAGRIRGDWDILLRGATLRLTVPEARILADGTSQIELRARLATTDGAGVAGRRIDFRTTRGAVSPSAQTGADGVAVATLTAADVADTAVVVARFGPSISDSGEVIFAPLIERIELSSNPASIRADGLDSARVSVAVTDGLGRGASGVRIDFASDRGRLSTRRVITGANGDASLFLYGVASEDDDSIRVIASTSGGSHRDTLYVRLRGVTVSLTASEDSLAANGSATARLTARVIETASGNPVESGRVFFSADRGSVTASAALGEGGAANATYTAPVDSGRATIRARYGEALEASTSMVLVDRVASLDLTVAPSSILANGVETAEFVIRVADPWGNGAPQELVSINFNGPGSVSPTVGRTDADGRLRVTARGSASTRDGRLIVTATVRNGRLSETLPLELRGVSIQLTASEALIPGDGRSVSSLVAALRETSSGHPVVGDTVRFTTTAGTISPFAVTDGNGEAAGQIRSAAESNIAVVVGSYGDRLTDTTRVAFTGRYSYLDLSLARASLLGDGADTTLATATLLDTLRRPVSGVLISFTALNGVGAPGVDTARTNGNGTATITFRSAPFANDTLARLRAFVGSLADTAQVSLRGVTLSISAAPDSIPANGVALSRISVQARETTRGNPVVNRRIFFSVDAGVIPAEATLDLEGRAAVNLRAAENAGNAAVTAELNGGLTVSRRVVFIPIVGSLTLQTARTTIYGDGEDTTLVVARLVDGARNPAPNVLVQFSSPGGGSLSPTEIETDEAGFARARFTGFASTSDTTFALRAVAEGGASATAEVTLTGLTLTLDASPDELPANDRAQSVVSALLTETTRHTPLFDRTVRFSADRGRINAAATTDSNGVARAHFTAPAASGTATLTASFGRTLSASENVNCYASTPRNVVLTVDPGEISVAGAGREASATVAAIVRDERGNLVGDGTVVLLKATPDIGLRFAGGLDSAVVRTTEGVARAVVSAGNQPGTARFRLFYNGALLATGGELTIRSGPPAQIRVRPDLGTIHRPAGGFTAFPAAAIVSDRYSNPVEDGTAVNFSLTPDSVASITSVGYTLGGVVSTPTEPIDYPTGVWLTYPNDAAGEVLYIHASAAGGEVVDSARVTLPGAVEGGEPSEMELGFDRNSLTADGVSTATLSIHLTDAEGRPVADMTEIELDATLGHIQTPRFSADGAAAALYRAGRTRGTDTVRVVSGNVSASISIRLLPDIPDRIELAIADDELRANGVESTTLTARLFDRNGNIVRTGTEVSFSSTLGEVTGRSETDSSGRAAARLTAGVTTGVALIRATAGAAEAGVGARFVSGEAAQLILISADRTTVGVRGSGVAETASLIFEARDDRGVAVDSLHPATVDFTLEGPAQVVDPDSSDADSIAYLSHYSARTDASGRTIVTLQSGYYAGAVQITAGVGQGIRGRAIALAIVGGPPDSSHFAASPARCVVTGIYGTPADSTLVNVTIGDRYSNPVTPGTVVRFSATGGVIQGAATVDSVGRCSAMIRTSQPWPSGGIDTIRAQTVDWRNREIFAETYLVVSGPTKVEFDTTDGWRIPFGSFRDFTVTIADTFGHPLVAGSDILITARALSPRGAELEGAVLTGDAVGEPVVLAECDPRTEFNVRLFNYVSGLDGADLVLGVVINSPNGDRSLDIEGAGLPQVLSTSESRVVLSPGEIVADGDEECQIAITVYDTLGVPIRSVPPDAVRITVAGGDPIVTPPGVPADDNGRIVGSFVARQIGQATVSVAVLGQQLDDRPTITLTAGPPALMTIQVLDRQLTVGGDTTTVSVYVTDANGNPTQDGTSVTFESEDGTFSPTNTTTTDGSARTILSSGITAGSTTVTVQALRRGVLVVDVSPRIEYLAGPPARISITAETFAVAVGSESEIAIAAEDQFGNPVQGGTRFDLSITPPANGSITPATVTTDTTGEASATFTAGTTAGAAARIIATDGNISEQSSQFTFQPGAPGRIAISANPSTLEVGAQSTISIMVEDAYGNDVSDTTRVAFTRNPQNGTLTPSSVRTSGGAASSVLSGVTEIGDVEVTATASDAAAAVRITFTVGDLASIEVEAAPQEVVVGNSSTITATASDQYGNPVSGEILRFQFASNPGNSCQLQNNQRRTGADGTASTIFTAGQTAGSAIVTVFFDSDRDGQLDDQTEPNGSAFVDIGAGQ